MGSFTPSVLIRRSSLLGCLAISLLAGHATAQTSTLKTRTEGTQVVPPVGTVGSGSATVTVNTQTNLVSINGTFSNLESDCTTIALHGPANVGQSGNFIAGFSFSGTTTGSYSFADTLDAGIVQDILDGRTYIDVHTVTWPGGELRGQICEAAAAQLRNAGGNPASYTIEAPVLGTSILAAVDLSTTGHGLAALFGFDSSTDITLSAGQHLLAVDGGSGELLGLSLQAGPIASFTLNVPNELSLCGLRVTTQAAHIGTVSPFALSNAQDLTLGY